MTNLSSVKAERRVTIHALVDDGRDRPVARFEVAREELVEGASAAAWFDVVVHVVVGGVFEAGEGFFSDRVGRVFRTPYALGVCSIARPTPQPLSL